jgi:hypothetical protein
MKANEFVPIQTGNDTSNFTKEGIVCVFRVIFEPQSGALEEFKRINSLPALKKKIPGNRLMIKMQELNSFVRNPVLRKGVLSMMTSLDTMVKNKDLSKQAKEQAFSLLEKMTDFYTYFSNKDVLFQSAVVSPGRTFANMTMESGNDFAEIERLYNELTENLYKLCDEFYTLLRKSSSAVPTVTPTSSGAADQLEMETLRKKVTASEQRLVDLASDNARKAIKIKSLETEVAELKRELSKAQAVAPAPAPEPDLRLEALLRQKEEENKELQRQLRELQAQLQAQAQAPQRSSECRKCAELTQHVRLLMEENRMLKEAPQASAPQAHSAPAVRLPPRQPMK